MIQQFFICLSLFTRLPLVKAGELKQENLSRSAWAFPLAGATIGALAAGIYLNLLACHLPHNIAAWIALGFLVWLTGGLHEDGIADMADGMAYGRSREQKLAIMRDSRIGCYGASTLIITLAIRTQAIAGFGSGFQTLMVFIIVGAASRATLPLLMYLLPPARSDGLAAAAGKPSRIQVIVSLLIGILSVISLGNPLLIASLLAALGLLCFVMGRFAQQVLGGITGDVLGALQQSCEIALWVILLAFLYPA